VRKSFTATSALTKRKTTQDRQCTCKRNNEARPWTHFLAWKGCNDYLFLVCACSVSYV